MKSIKQSTVKQKGKKKMKDKNQSPMVTSTAIQILTNSELQLDAANSHIVDGGIMNQPGLIALAPIDPDPEIADDLANKISEIQDSVDKLFTWALAH